ncbi:TRAP transporter small permease [Salipiger sp.]|uniref:TRAP transporter small permease n=1 Tax=Salipiger sp. TaxID=2078585 RepID=UPI003A96DA98
MQHLIKSVDAVTRLFAVIAGVAVVVMMVHVNFDVLLRALLNKVPPGTIVFVSNYYMVFLVCLPLAFVERMGAHISVDVFTDHLPGRVQRRLAGWVFLLSAAVFALVAYASWLEAAQQFRKGTFMIEQDYKIPVWYGYFALPIGYGLGAVYMLMRFARFLTGGDAPPPDSAAPDIADPDSQVEMRSHD